MSERARRVGIVALLAAPWLLFVLVYGAVDKYARPDIIMLRYVEAGGESHPVLVVSGRLSDGWDPVHSDVYLTGKTGVVLVKLCHCRYAMRTHPRLYYTPVAPVCRDGLRTSAFFAGELLRPSVDGVDFHDEETGQ